MTTQDLLKLAASAGITFAAAAVGSVGSASAPAFYGALDQPGWAPPAALFGPVWTALYALMAIAAWLVWRRGGAEARVALGWYLGQLVLNALWSWLFFRWQMGAAAVAEIVVLWGAIAVTLVLFARISRLAAGLLVPYLVWVTYAAALTVALWRMNPGSL